MRVVILGLMIYLTVASVASAGTISGIVQLNGRGAHEVIVYLEGVKGKFPTPKKPVTMVQEGKIFMPTRLPILKGSTVSLPNKDKVFHNAFSISAARPFNLGSYGPGESPSVKFKNPGIVDIFCDMHEQMYAVIIVLEHPFFSLTDREGRYTIVDVPAGTYEVKTWKSRSEIESRKVTVVEGTFNFHETILSLQDDLLLKHLSFIGKRFFKHDSSSRTY